MTLEEVHKAIKEGGAGFVKQEQTEQPKENPKIDDYAKFLIMLEMLRRPKYHLTSAPDFTPKTFLEQIQFVDDGDLKVYFYINGSWGSITLS